MHMRQGLGWVFVPSCRWARLILLLSSSVLLLRSSWYASFVYSWVWSWWCQSALNAVWIRADTLCQGRSSFISDFGFVLESAVQDDIHGIIMIDFIKDCMAQLSYKKVELMNCLQRLLQQRFCLTTTLQSDDINIFVFDLQKDCNHSVHIIYSRYL